MTTAPETTRSRRSPAAYTLIEILIVVAILGISAAILAPNLVNRNLMNVQAAVRLLIGDLSFAQSDALAHQEFRRVHFYPNGTGYCLVRITATELGQPFNAATADYINDPLARSGQLGRYIVDFTADQRFDGVTVESVDLDGGGRNIQYDALGGTVMAGGGPGTGGTIVIAMGTDRYEITVAPFTGKLTVRRL